MTKPENEQGPGPQPVPPRRRGLRLALVGSLVLNLLLAGVLAGGALRAWQVPVQPAMAEMRALWQVLPGETRRALHDEFRGHPRAGQGMRGHGRHGAAAEPALPGLLRAEPFDAEAFAAALGMARDHRAERASRAEAALARHLGALSTNERAAIAQALEERLERRTRREGWRERRREGQGDG